jgi:hypothetical protein
MPQSDRTSSVEPWESDELQELYRLRRELGALIDEEIERALRQGPTDLEAVDKAVSSQATVLMEKLGPLLGSSTRRNMIRDRLKRLDVPDENPGQLQLAFAEFELFQGVQQLTWESKAGHVEYVRLRKSRQLQRHGALKLKGDGIVSDQSKYLRQKAINDFFDPLVKRYGDLDAEVLFEYWQKEQQEKPQAGRVRP